MVDNAERQRHVQTLRAIARDCLVAGIPQDNAGRPTIQRLLVAIRASSASTQQLAVADAAHRAYEGTLVGAVLPQPAVSQMGPQAQTGAGASFRLKGKTSASLAGPQAQTGVGGTFRLRGKSFLFTYNYDFLGLPLPDGTPAPACASDLWTLWNTWKVGAEVTLGVVKSTSTLERSLDSPLAGRVHFHWMADLKKAVDHSSTSAFAFHGVAPDARATWSEAAKSFGRKKARGGNWDFARRRGHFYCWAPKTGTLETSTNFLPFKDYRVVGQWVEDLWVDGKLEHDVYDGLSARAKRGHASRKRDLDAVRTDESNARVDARIKAVAKALEQITAPSRKFSVVTAWEDSFLKLDHRWKILILCADSRAGKSNYAEGLFDAPFVITVEDADYLDLKGFDLEKNDGIVLDNVNSWGQLLKWRAVLQARNAKSKGGQSATNCHAYGQYLFSVPVVATVDLDAPDAYLVDPGSKWQSRWLLANTTVLRLPPGEKFYEESQVPRGVVPNEFSLFAQTVKRRRAQAAVSPPNP